MWLWRWGREKLLRTAGFFTLHKPRKHCIWPEFVSTLQIRNVEKKEGERLHISPQKTWFTLHQQWQSEWIPGVEGSVAKCSWGSSAVKCANWKLARESNSQFQTLLTETKFQVYGRIKRWRRHLQTVWICFLPSFSIWGFTWSKMIEEKELTNVTWYQEDRRKVDIYHNMFV